MSRLHALQAGGMSGRGTRVYHNANQSISDDTATFVSFNTERQDDLGAWASGDPDHLTAPMTGWYLVSFSARFAGNSTNSRLYWVERNPTSETPLTGTVVAAEWLGSTTSSEVDEASVNTLTYLSSGDTLYFGVRQNSTGALNLESYEQSGCEVQLVYLGGQRGHALQHGGLPGLACRAYHNTNQSIANGTSTFLSFNTLRRDELGCWSSGDPDHFTIPRTGLYYVGLHVAWETNANYIRKTFVERNPTTETPETGTWIAQSGMLSSGNLYETRQGIASLAYLTAGDTLYMGAWQNSTGSLNILAANEYGCEAILAYLGGA